MLISPACIGSLSFQVNVSPTDLFVEIEQTSFLNIRSQNVTKKQITLQNFKYAPRVRCGTPHFALQFVLNYGPVLKSTNVRESFTIECEKDSKGSEKACVEPYCLACRSV